MFIRLRKTSSLAQICARSTVMVAGLAALLMTAACANSRGPGTASGGDAKAVGGELVVAKGSGKEFPFQDPNVNLSPENFCRLKTKGQDRARYFKVTFYSATEGNPQNLFLDETDKNGTSLEKSNDKNFIADGEIHEFSGNYDGKISYSVNVLTSKDGAKIILNGQTVEGSAPYAFQFSFDVNRSGAMKIIEKEKNGEGAKATLTEAFGECKPVEAMPVPPPPSQPPQQKATPKKKH